MRNSRAGGRRQAPGLLFLLPSLAGVGIFVLIPFADVIRRSFTAPMTPDWVGLQNYRAVLENQAFRLALGNTLKFLAVCIPVLLALSLMLSLVLYALGEQAGVWRTVCLLPMAVPVASVALLWQALFHKAGLINGWIARLGGAPPDWMGSSLAFPVLVLSFLWKNMGWSVILWLAGLGGINPSLYEAAEIDGAGAWRKLWNITLPGLVPSLAILLLINLMNAFKVFREAWLVAGDYPHESIYLLQHLFGNWFRDLSMEKLSAGAVLVALGCLALCLGLGRAWRGEGEP